VHSIYHSLKQFCSRFGFISTDDSIVLAFQKPLAVPAAVPTSKKHFRQSQPKSQSPQLAKPESRATQQRQPKQIWEPFEKSVSEPVWKPEQSIPVEIQESSRREGRRSSSSSAARWYSPGK
jgi:hypothetical protein